MSSAPMTQANTDIALSLRNVGVRYRRRRRIFASRDNEHWALAGITLDLYRGEALGVIGPNGAGKSTLLRLLAGIIRPDHGEIENHGYSAALLSLQLGFVPNLSGLENAMLSGMYMGLSKAEVRAALPAIEALAELGDFFGEPVSTYSAGMRARLGFAVAQQANPDILLIDEVLGVGDEAFRKKSEAMLKAKIESAQTVVLVSHSPSTVNKLCDRVLWIERGTVHDIGTPQSVLPRYTQPATPRPTK